MFCIHLEINISYIKLDINSKESYIDMLTLNNYNTLYSEIIGMLLRKKFVQIK